MSVSCPTAEISGIGQDAAARTTISSLNAIRSSRLPPPRATISTSGRGCAWQNPLMAAAIFSAAPSPCTGTGHNNNVRGKRRAMVVRMSWITAPRSLLTTPITFGSSGNGRLRASSAPAPAYSIRLMMSW